MDQTDARFHGLYEWVQQQKNDSHIVPIPGDASNRRYFRIFGKQESYIAVDAPPSMENNQAFVHIAQAFLRAGLNVPQIFSVNFEEGFLLLSDLGDIQLLKILDDTNVNYYYTRALSDLIRLQNCQEFGSWQLPIFDEAMLLTELERFHEWYLQKHLNVAISECEMAMLQHTYAILIKAATEQPKVCTHRDYHSRNLMVLPNNELGILDFQDSAIGPITYDLVSLLRDCYIKWSPDKVNTWVEQFWQLLTIEQQKDLGSIDRFSKYFDWMGLQRHLKVLGIFARLFRRDNKTIYLQDIPRILEYVLFICDKYQEFKPLKEFITIRVMQHESHDFSSRAWQSDASTHR